MKVAVTYKDGEIFGHFGKTEEFKIYEVDPEAVKVIGSEVVSTDGVGHEAMAKFLADKGVELLICGGIGEGAQQALDDADIKFISGASGNADEVINSLFDGDLESEGVNCDCGGNCGEDGGCGGCGGDCGGCGGCGGCAPTPLLEGENAGKICSVHYHGTLDDGTCFDSSYERGKPLQFICGVGMMIRGFDEAVANMKVGEIVNVHLEPEEAYGQPDPRAIFDLEIAKLPGSEDLNVGDQVVLNDAYGREVPVKVIEKTETMIKLDANHEMAGKALNFKIELVSVMEQ